MASKFTRYFAKRVFNNEGDFRMISIIIFACIGLCIAVYTYVIERKIKEDPTYKSVCDISDRISCSKPIKSAYANVFFFSNAVMGILFYVLVGILAFFHAPILLLITMVAGCISSCVFAYILYFKIKALCLLCTSLYVVNGILLYLVIRMML